MRNITKSRELDQIHEVDWLGLLKHFFTNVSFHILGASLNSDGSV